MVMLRSSVTHVPHRPSGRNGRLSRFNTGMRIHSRRCSALNEAFRHSTIPMSTSLHHMPLLEASNIPRTRMPDKESTSLQPQSETSRRPKDLYLRVKFHKESRVHHLQQLRILT